MSTPAPMLLQVHGLQAWYGQAQALHGVDLQIPRGGVVALLGANGAGKTTTLRAICGMIRARGRIMLDGQELCGRATAEIARLGVAHVPEGRGTFNELTVLENLQLGAISRGDATAREADMALQLDYFPPLRERLAQQAGTLSGGEQQMLAISRALMLRPRLLLLDEPSFGLAPMIVREIFEIMKRINSEQGVSMLLVEQNAHLALELADHAYLMETGHVVLDDSAQGMAGREDVQAAYLGTQLGH